MTRLIFLDAHDDSVTCVILADNSKLISCCADGSIKIWSLEIFICIQTLEGHSDTIYHLELTSNGKLLSCSGDQTMKLWQIETGEMLKSFEFDDAVRCVKNLNDDLFVISLENEEILIYDFKIMESVKKITNINSSINYFQLLSNGNLLTGADNGEINLLKIY